MLIGLMLFIFAFLVCWYDLQPAVLIKAHLAVRGCSQVRHRSWEALYPRDMGNLNLTNSTIPSRVRNHAMLISTSSPQITHRRPQGG